MLFIGDDWAEDHHDIELADDDGRLLTRRRLPEGIEGIAGLHALVAEHLGEDLEELEADQLQAMVKVGIETDRGPWVAALVAAGYEVYAINPMSVTRYRERHSTSGAKSDAADAHLLAEIVRLDRAHHRPLAGDSEEAEAIKLVARTHQSLVWERSRHVLRLRAALRDFFPAALRAFPDLDAPDALELLVAAPDPDRAARLTKARIAAALRRANRRNVEARASEIRQVLRAEELRRSPAVQSAYAAIVASQASVVQALNAQIQQIGAVVDSHFGQHPDAEIYASQPGLGVVLAARVLGEFGDDPHRYTDAKARKSYAGTAPITKASGKKKIVLARYARNRRLGDALQQWAFCSLRGSPGATAYYRQLRARNIGHQAALRQVANRLVGILHGCLKTHTTYDEATAWSHHMPGAA
ncbi:MAG TPA: IS110 family transposase [Nocardioidaceae bacterium]|nr:IS110 family transposase [Nocardioidaceae bacterium]